MKKLIITIFSVFVLTSCGGGDKATYTLEGTTMGIADGTKVYLYEDMFRRISTDSTTVQDGKFIFTGKLEKPVARYMKVEGAGPKKEEFAEGIDPDDFVSISSFVVLEPNKIDVLVNSKGQFTTTGSPLTKKHTDYLNNLGKTGSPDTNDFISYIAENKDNAIGINYFVSVIEFVEPTSKQLKELYPVFIDKKEEDKRVADVLNYIENLDSIAAVGTKYIDLKGKDPENADIALSDYAGKDKIVLLHFWRSVGEWYTKSDIQFLVKTYEKYKNKGFEIVSVYADINGLDWKKEIEEFDMTWPQIWNKKQRTEFIKAYAMLDYPATVLIDKDGTIIARNVSAEELDGKLNELLQ